MRRIINNRVYDTDTAKFIGSWNNRAENKDGYIEESLYYKQVGEYFIYGKGGKQTKYAKLVDNVWEAGEAIRGIKYEEAMEIKKRFPKQKEENKKKNVTIMIVESFLNKLSQNQSASKKLSAFKKLSASTRQSASKMLNEILESSNASDYDESEPTVKRTFYIDSDIISKIKREALENGVSISKRVNQKISAYLGELK